MPSKCAATHPITTPLTTPFSLFFIDPDGLAPTGATGAYGESLENVSATRIFGPMDSVTTISDDNGNSVTVNHVGDKINKISTNINSNIDCPSCDNPNILTDFVTLAAIEEGKDIANNRILKNKKFDSEVDMSNYWSVSLKKAIQITGDKNLNFKSGFGKFVQDLLTGGVADLNTLEFTQKINLKLRNGDVKSFLIEGELHLKTDLNDLNILTMVHPKTGYDYYGTGGFLAQITFLNNKNEIVARLKFRNKEIYNGFMDQYYLKHQRKSYNDAVREYLNQKN